MTDTHRENAAGLARKTALVCGVILAFLLLLVLLWQASTGIVAIAVAMLLAVLLDAAARGIGHVLPVSRQIRLLIVFALAAAAISITVWWGGEIIVRQANDFAAAVSGLVERANAFLKHDYGLFQGDDDLKTLLPSASMLFGGATAVAATLFNAATLVFAIVFLGVFFAVEPPLYKAIALSLLPRDKRQRVDGVLDMAGEAMRDWLIGQSICMAVIFAFSFVALMLAGMPYWAMLSVQAGLLTFIPTLGPFIAGIVIILAGLSQSFSMAIYGLAIYLGIQFIESNLVTPLVQERTVRLAPAGTLALQVIAGYLFGFLGVAFAVPLAAAGKVFVEELYIKDRLGGGWAVPQSDGPSWMAQATAAIRQRFTR